MKKMTKCLNIHKTAKLEIELYGEIVSASVADHLEHCPNQEFVALVEEKTDELSDEFAKILAAAQPAGERASSWNMCGNAPGGGTKHFWTKQGDSTYCVNCGWRKGRFNFGYGGGVL